MSRSIAQPTTTAASQPAATATTAATTSASTAPPPAPQRPETRDAAVQTETINKNVETQADCLSEDEDDEEDFMDSDPRKKENCIISRRNAYFLLYSMVNGDYDSKESILRMAEAFSDDLVVDPESFKK